MAEDLVVMMIDTADEDDAVDGCGLNQGRVVETMFVDIAERCKADRLSVYARYQRRGGIDINPFRSNFEDCPENLRLWRQ